MDFAEFVAKEPPTTRGYTAWVEQLPEWPEILAAWQAGAQAPMIRKWLIRDKGYDPVECSSARVEQHLYKKHPRG